MHAIAHTVRCAACAPPLLQSLLEGLRQHSIAAVRVAGPHGAGEATLGCQLSPPDSWLRYESLLLIGGGVGVSSGWQELTAVVLAFRTFLLLACPRIARVYKSWGPACLRTPRLPGASLLRFVCR